MLHQGEYLPENLVSAKSDSKIIIKKTKMHSTMNFTHYGSENARPVAKRASIGAIIVEVD